MRRFALPIALILTASPLVAQQPQGRNSDPDVLVRPAGAMPSGWQAVTDGGRPAEGLSFVSMGRGFHATMGPAAIFFNPANTMSGNYRVGYSFTQTKAPAHPEAYGIFFGGTDLTSATGKAYSYFLVRKTGEYFIATMRGNERTIVQNWAPHAAIAKENAAGRQVNSLAIEARGDEVIFSANGTEIARRPKGEILSDGIAGFRINHNLDVMIEPAE